MTRKSQTEGPSGAPDDGAPEGLPLEPRVLKDLLEFPADVLAPVPAGMRPDHLLLETVRNDDISLSVKCPDPEASPGDVLQLLVDGIETGGEVLVDPYLPDMDVPLVLPAASRTEGRHNLNYKIKYLSGTGGQEELGPPGQQFIADYTAPGGDQLPELLFSPDVIADGITPDKLTVDPNGDEYLSSDLIPYLEKAWGDRLQALIDDVPAGVAMEVPEDVAPVIVLPFPRAALEAAGDGWHEFSCEIIDRAGNRAVVPFVELLVRFSGVIPDLLPPVVPGAADGLVTDSDARVDGGVTVEIPGHPSIQTGDTVTWSWNGRASAPIPVTQNGQDPLLTVTAAYGDVYDDWFAVSGDTDQDVPAAVTYIVARSGADIGRPAQPAEPPVNLYGPGGKDPDPATPEHENLLPAVVQGAGGGPVNIIPADELDEDATATIPGMTAETPPRPAFRVGDRIQFYWDALAVDTEAVVDTVGADVTRTIPSTVLQAHSPGLWPVHYVVTRALATVPFVNRAVSPPQTVDVKDTSDIPGEGRPLERAKWVEGPAGGLPDQIDYDKAISGGGTPLRIYAYANMAEGDEIRATFQGFDRIQEPPIAQPIPESTYRVVRLVEADDLIPKSDDTVTPPVDAVYVDILVPTENLLPIEYGRAHFDYTVTNAAGSGTARQAWIYVATRH